MYKGVGKMRNWLWVAGLTVALGGVCGYWYFTTTPSVTLGPQGLNGDVASITPGKGDGDAETSEAFEPLIVDRGGSEGVQTPEPALDDGPMARVLLEPGMQQPPRPDAGSGRVPRMPYADEEEILDLSRSPLSRILESRLPFLNIFQELEKVTPDEEFENTEVPVPTVVPAPNYHQNHCPRTGGCPAPYPYRRD
jgi:hypothetical protein